MSKQEAIVNIKVAAQGIEEAYKQIQKLTKTEGIDITKGMESRIKELEVTIPSLLKNMQNKIDSQQLSPFDASAIDKETKKVIKSIQAVYLDLQKVNLPKDLNDQIDAVQKKIEASQQELKRLRGNNLGLNAKTRDGNLAKTEQNAIFAEKYGSVAVKDQQIGSFTEFEATVKKLDSENKLTAEEAAEFNEILSQMNDAISQRLAELQKQIDTNNASIQTHKNNVTAGKAKLNDINANFASTGATEKEKQITAEVVEGYTKLADVTGATEKALNDVSEAEQNKNTTVQQGTQIQEKNTGTLAKAAKQVFTYGTVISAFRKVYASTIRTVKEMDKALTDMAVVTRMSRAEAYEMAGTFQTLAQATGATSTEVANVATKFYQQGKTTSQVLKLTEASLRAAKIAGLDSAQAVDLLTNAMNGFQMSSEKALEVSDKFAALAAASATDYEELATALSKVAAQANLAGMSMDFTLGMLAKGIEVTREAPETIGTALKTVISRMRELTDYGATLEDGIDVNRVAKALSNIGVELMDENNQFRDLELVLTEVGQKWGTLNTNQQANVAVALAGTRQQSRLIAMMQDFDRTLELVDISANSYGATMAQSEKYMEGLGAAMNKFSSSWEAVVTNFTNSDLIVGVINTLTYGLQALADNTWAIYTVAIAVGAVWLANLAVKQKMNIANQQLLITQTQAAIKEKQAIIDQKNMAIEQAKARIKILQTVVATDKKTNATEEATIAVYQQNVALAKNNKLTGKGTDAEIASAEADLLKAQATDKQTDAISQNAAVANEAEIKAEQDNIAQLERERNLAISQKESLELQDKINVVQLKGMQISSALNVIGTITALVNKMIAASKMKKAQAEAADTTATTANTVAQEANNAAVLSNPYVAFAVAIIAVTVALIALIAILVKSANSMSAVDKAVKQSEEDLEKLHAELYRLNSSIATVNSLAAEFENLSNKIIKSTEDLERMNEIAQSINDEAGRNIVNMDADIETQLQQIKGYQELQKDNKRLVMKDMNATIQKGATAANIAVRDKMIKDSSDTTSSQVSALEERIATGKTLQERAEEAGKDAENEYLAKLSQTEAGIQTLRTVGLYDMSTELTDVSAKTQDAILDMLETTGTALDKEGKLIHNIFSTEGIKTDNFKDLFGEEQFSTYVKNLDTALTSGSLAEYGKFYENLTKEQQDLTKETLVMFKVFDKFSSKDFTAFDNIGFAKEEIDYILQTLTEIEQLNGTTTEDNLARMLQEGTTRAEVYKQLTEQQLKFAELVITKDEETINSMNAAKDAVEQADTALKEANNTLDGMSKKSGQSEEEFEAAKEKQQDVVDEAAAKLALAKEEYAKYADAVKNAQQAIINNRQLLGLQSAIDMTEDISKLTSAMERVAKVTDLANLSFAEQIELMNDYPSVAEAMGRGFLNAGEKMGLYQEQIADTLEQAERNITGYQATWQYDFNLMAQSGQNGYDSLFGQDESAMSSRMSLINETLTNESDLVQSIYKSYLSKDSQGNQVEGLTINQALDKARQIQADAKEMNNVMRLQKLLAGDNGVINLMKQETVSAWEAASDMQKLAQGRVDQYSKELEKLNIGTDEYSQKLNQRNNAILTANAKFNNKLEDIQKKRDEALAGANIKDADGNLRKINDFYEEIDGQIFINEEAIQQLDETQQNAVRSMVNEMQTWAKESKEATDQIAENNETLAQSYIDTNAKALEDQIASLESRKEAYEKYFESLDNLDKERDRTESLNDITAQLASLAGGSGSATAQLRKDLLSQMEDLKDEEIAARKEALRQEVLDNLDKQTEELNNQLDALNGSINDLYQLLKAGTYQASVENNAVVITDANGNQPKFAKGGLVDFTGPAWVDGSTTRPEAFLSAIDTANIQKLLDALQLTLEYDTNVDTTEIQNNNSTAINVGDIIIQTNELNNDQDFKKAGSSLVDEIAKAAKQGGININVKK